MCFPSLKPGSGGWTLNVSGCREGSCWATRICSIALGIFASWITRGLPPRSFAPWKMMVGRRFFPIGKVSFQGANGELARAGNPYESLNSDCCWFAGGRSKEYRWSTNLKARSSHSIGEDVNQILSAASKIWSFTLVQGIPSMIPMLLV